MRVIEILLAMSLLCACGDGATDAEPDAEPLGDPALGEWPTFKRDLAHTGLAPGKGAITASNFCIRWQAHLTCDTTRGASGALIATIAGVPTVFFVVDGPKAGCSADTGGFAFALDANGHTIWERPLPGGAQSDPYAPTLADIDGDGARELIFASNNSDKVFALRTEDEPEGEAGTIQWTFTLPDAGARSEGAPIVADLDPSDARPEIVIGSDYSGVEGATSSKVFVLDGLRGTIDGAPFEAPSRASLASCEGGNKIDSSSPTVAVIGGMATVYVGAWNGRFYALAWRDDPPGLFARWTDELPPSTEHCPLRKVRSGAVLGQIIPGGAPEIAYGHMLERPSPADYESALVRIVSADGLGLVAEVDVDVWKSTPSLADLDPARAGLELVAGRYRGVSAVGANGDGFAAFWDPDWGDGNGGWGGNRTSPAIADLDGDDDLEMVIGVEGLDDPALLALDAATGAVEWRLDLPGSDMDSSPAIGDIDGDGALEIVFLARSGEAYAIDSNPDAARGGEPCPDH